MSRVQLALNVENIDDAVAFYQKLFGTEPAKRRPGYANFAIVEPPLKLVLIENGTQVSGSLNHLGVEVESPEALVATQARLSEAGVATAVESDVTCCFATQDKVWASSPEGLPWEFYTVLSDADAVGDSPRHDASHASVCCSHRPDLAAAGSGPIPVSADSPGCC